MRPNSNPKEYYINRELSWLSFNERVLDEALSETTPLFEKLKFIAIYANNLDEFYMIRVGGLYDQSLLKNMPHDNKTGMSAREQLAHIFKRTVEIIPKKDAIYDSVTNQLGREGVSILNYASISGVMKKYLEEYFDNEIFTLLSPQIIDAKHPFPHLNNKEIYVGVYLKTKETNLFGVIPASGIFDRLVVLSNAENLNVALVEDLILSCAEKVFSMYEVVDKTLFRITRNADIDVDEGFFDEDRDYKEHMKELLKKRGRLAPVRLELSNSIKKDFEKYLCKKLNISDEQVFVSKSPLDMSFVYKIEDMLPHAQAKKLLHKPLYPQHSVMLNENENVTRQVLKKDVLVSYPYESMKPLHLLLAEASGDPSVVSIKITLYRISDSSKIAEYLIAAAENKKDVTVVVELKARFDEENNIKMATRLEAAGCRIVYGLDGYKVHAKIMLITRKSSRGIQYIAHFGTGNYNEKTAHFYTDLNLITSNQKIGMDAVAFFNNLTLGNIDGEYSYLLTAPRNLKNRILGFIEEEIAREKRGEGGSILAKMNSLTDKEIIDKLVEASQAGVRVRLVIRGICCLKAGIPGITGNISVVSIVGRYLEHSRIFCFGNGEGRKLYISSADWMTRNTERRVEIACPIIDKNLSDMIYGMLETMLMDNVKARVMLLNGEYKLKNRYEDIAFDSQMYFFEEAYSRDVLRLTAAAEMHQGGNFKFVDTIRKTLKNLLDKGRY